MDNNSKVIGILGTAKNTGKTTTFNFLLEWSNSEKIKTGLTSIGYDGEDIDNITGLPKPRILIEKCNIIATAEQCLFPFKDRIEIIEKTSVNTALGPVVIGKAKKEGMAILAGPNKGIDLQAIINKLKQQRVELVLVDGALNRMIPLINCDALIIATGASRHTDIGLLVDEIESMTRVFNLPIWEKEDIFKDEIRKYKNNILIFRKNGFLKQLSGHSLLGHKTFSNLISNIDDPEYDGVYIPGIIQEAILKKIADKYYQLFQGKTIIINNPTFLLIGSREINHLKDLIGDLFNKGINIETLYNLPILAVTINPFYPKYNRLGKGSYEMASIDGLQLSEQMTGRINFPVINIRGKESSKLLMEVKKFLKTGNR